MGLKNLCIYSTQLHPCIPDEENGRSELPSDVKSSLNITNEIQALINSTIYKHTFLK